MRIGHRFGIAIVAAVLATGAGVGRAGDPPKPSTDPQVDPSLLEFLGNGDPSSDSAQADDGSWLAYLSQVNIGKVAKAPQAPTQPKPACSAAGADKPSG